ncbi:hypothetical protein VPHG_00182 [Vibrio phage 11895-B1]|uniref:hypothetical protein n=1 Tax=Vibrio phage 11895-B1 TaxID=754075 RepID=UPI0002C11688|nr:hypothetical protein VPHG_00182 [Vibrio phage 11895-B1]AGH32245.1 hypothetical protein VPHG_00182 [Vibrio phage 11895-B1]
MMLSTLFTLYVLSGVIFAGYLIFQIILDNKLPRHMYWWCLFFGLHTLIVVLICLISYAFLYNQDMKKRMKQRNGD